MKTTTRFLVLAAALGLVSLCEAADLVVTAVNKLPFARVSQTIELSAAQLAPLGAGDLGTVHVKDAAGHELICQAVDTDYDDYHTPDIIIFQADFAAGEAKTFTVTKGRKQEFAREQFKAFGRFVRERFDDFAWENDCIAHRTYGKALETWKGEPLASSTIDIWSKRTPRLVINDWYLADHYHEDTGEGADFYSAGNTRGCGGNGLWAANRLWVSRNFVRSRVLANGPIRVLFELEYEPFDVNGISVSEVKRISLDAGSQLDHFESRYTQFSRPGQAKKLTTAIGLKKVGGEQKESDAARGWLLQWEKMEKNAGNQGLAIVMDPKQWEGEAGDEQNDLVLATVGDGGTVSYWAGFCWEQSSPFKNAGAWKQHMDEFARGLASPIEVSVSVK